ncbi:MAG: sigma-70 family RNA polymerase sigma factor [Bacteroidota bacterium]
MNNLNEIIKGCKKGSKVHQKELYCLYSKILFNLSLKYCTSFSEAEDNLHDSFIEIFSKIDNFKNTGTFEGWMKKITINKAISKFKNSLHFESAENLIYPIQDTEIEINQIDISLNKLLELIQSLPNQYRLVFSLYELDHYSHKEIAEMLKISEGSSKSNLYKAKSILKKQIVEFKSKIAQNGY